MRIGILEAGKPPAVLQPAFGGYPGMVEHMLGPSYTYATFDVVGAPPPVPEACDAFVITGAAAGVYDDLAWIPPLEDFLRGAKGRVPLIGICFGHQLMAQAFGGVVEKSAKGWCTGLHAYQVVSRLPWMEATSTIAIPSSHQDQVVAAPPNTRTVLASAFTPLGALAYEDQPAISFQGHPEFEPDFAQALYESRLDVPYDEGQAERVIASLAAPNDRATVAKWIRAFLDRGS